MVEYEECVKSAKIIVVGDLIIDKYVYGSVKKICPEAPVPIVNVMNSAWYLGGASNVARNIKSLGHEPYFISLVGDDKYGRGAMEMLDKEEIPHQLHPTMMTTVKKRIIGNNHIMLRVDEDNFVDEHIDLDLPPAYKHFIVVSDYGKGAINAYTIPQIWAFAKANSIPILLDPYPKNYSLYPPTKYIKLNGLQWSQIDKKEALSRFENIIVTLGEEGCIIINKDGENLVGGYKEVALDPSGAGDTFAAILAVCLAKRWKLDNACDHANLGASQVVKRMGIHVPDLRI